MSALINVVRKVEKRKLSRSNPTNEENQKRAPIIVENVKFGIKTVAK